MNDIIKIGPDGHEFVFEEGTPEEVQKAFIQRWYGTTPAANRDRLNAATALSPVNPRSVWERWTDNLSNTFNTSWIGEGWRAGFDDAADYADLGRQGRHDEAIDRADDMSWNPSRLVARLVASPVMLWDAARGSNDLRNISDDMVERERARKAEFGQESAEDPWFGGDRNIFEKGLHGASALTGTLAGAALDPTSYITGGSTVWGRIGIQAAIAGGVDALAQSDAVGLTQDEYHWEQTALSAAAGGAFMGVAEGIGHVLRKPGAALPTEADAAPVVREVLDADDAINRPILIADASKPTPRAAPVEAPQVEAPKVENALQPVAPKTGGGKSRADGAEAKADEAATDDPWNGIDWGKVGSPERVKAALAHLDRLKTFIKPDQVHTFVRWLGKETVEISDDAGHWNRDFFDFDKLANDPDKFLEVTAVMADIFRPLYDAAGDAKVTWASVRNRQDHFGITLSDAIKAHSDITSEHGVAAKIHALETVSIQQTDALMTVMRTLEDNLSQGIKDADVIAKVAQQLQAATMLDAMAAGAKSEIGRALNIMKMQKKRARLVNDIQEQWDALSNALGSGGLTDEAMAAALKRLREAYGEGGARAMKNEARKMRQMGVTDYLSYYIVSGYLTTPATAIRNAIGSVLHATLSIGERYVAATVTSPIRRTLGGSRTSGERVTFREANAYVHGVHQSFVDAARAAGKAFADARPVTDSLTTIGDSVRQTPFAVDAARLARWKKGGLLAIPDMAMTSVFFTLRTLGIRPSLALDEFTKVMTRRMELNALAVREASYRSMRLKGADARKEFARTLDAVQTRPTAEALAEAKQTFDQVGEEFDPAKLYRGDSRLEDAADVLQAVNLQEMANDYARMMAFQKTGPTAEAFERAMNRVKFIKALYVPFFRTPINLVRAGMVDRNPALAWVTKENRAAFANYFSALDGQERALSRGGAEADIVMARMVTGIGFMSMASYLFSNGDLVGKRSPAEEQDGIKSYSIRIGGRWYQYSQLSPLAEMLGLVADMSQAWRDKDVADEMLTAMAGGVLGAITNNIVNKAALQGVGDFFDILDPAFATTDTTRGKAAAKALFKKTGDALVPAIVRNYAWQQDPVMREASDFIEAFKVNLPGLSESVAARRDWLGNPIVRPPQPLGLFQPMRVSAENADLVAREVSILAEADPDLRIASRPAARFNGQRITPEEHARVLEIQGQEFVHPGTGKTMHEALDELIRSDAYAAMEDAQRAREIKDMTSTFRRLANSAIKRGLYPELDEMVNRTGTAEAAEVGAERGLNPEQTRNRARRYGVDDDAAALLDFQPGQ